VVRTGNALRLSAVDQAARALGLAVGMTLADARARVPTLETRPHDAEADVRALERTARAMIRFTPLVELDPPDGLVLDVTGCAHLFGGEEALVREALTEPLFTARHALGPNREAARALVRHGGGSTDPLALPTEALELPEDALCALRRAGLTTLGDLARRPLAGLAARFGAQAVTRLRRILGEADSPLTPLLTPAPLRLERRFPEPIARTDTLLLALGDLLHEARAQLEERQSGGRRFTVLLCRSDGDERRLKVETARPVRDPAVIMRLLNERIEGLADPLDPGFGFDAVRLAVAGIEPLAPRQAALEDDGRESDEGLAALIDRLGTRLGPERVCRLAPRDTHLPEKAQALVPAAAPTPDAWPAPRDAVARPLHLFDPPQPIQALAEVPDGPPQRFRWQGRLHEVRLAEGPERIAAEWWRRVDGHFAGKGGLTRDYYRVEDSTGRRFWVFRHGLFGEPEHPRWYLHGLFP